MKVAAGTDSGRIILEAIIAAAMKALVSLVPFLGWPGVSLVVAWLVGKLTDAIWSVLVNLKIDFEVDGQNEDFKKAKDALEKAQESGDVAAIQKAADEFRARARDLIKY